MMPTIMQLTLHGVLIHGPTKHRSPLPGGEPLVMLDGHSCHQRTPSPAPSDLGSKDDLLEIQERTFVQVAYGLQKIGAHHETAAIDGLTIVNTISLPRKPRFIYVTAIVSR